MALGGIPFAVLFVVFFSPPAALGPFEISMWFGVFYVLFYLGDTLTVTPYQAWGSELTDDSKVRPSGSAPSETTSHHWITSHLVIGSRYLLSKL